MISGIKSTLKLKRLVLVALYTGVFGGIFGGPSGAAGGQSDPAGTLTLPKVMAAVAKVSEGTVFFVEERHLYYLQEPIRVEGSLSYVAPAQLEKRITSPTTERQVIRGDILTIEGADGDAVTRVRISDYPILGTVITGLRTILSGDVDALRRVFVVEFKTQGQDWSISMAPKDDDVRLAVKDFVIRGVQDKVTEVYVAEPDESWTVIKITYQQ